MGNFASILASWGDETFSRMLFWGVGFFALALIVLQAIFGIFVGHDGDTNTDSAVDTHGGHGGYASYLSIKGISAVLLGFGFGGAFLDRMGLGIPLAAAGGIAIGLVIATTYIALMNSLHKLKSDGTAILSEAVERTGTVYLPIPSGGTDAGEIQVSYGGRLQNVRAFTQGPSIPAGTSVRVIALHGDQALLVEKISQ